MKRWKRRLKIKKNENENVNGEWKSPNVIEKAKWKMNDNE